MPGVEFTPAQMEALEARSGRDYQRLVKKSQRPLFEQAMAGDYSNFDNLNDDLRAFVAERYMAQFMQSFRSQMGVGEHVQVTPQAFFHATQSPYFLETAMLSGQVDPMNPALRQGLSMKAAAFRREGDAASAAYADAFNDFLTDCVMKRTITPITEKQYNNLSTSYGKNQNELRDDIVRDYESKIFMSKLLMMGHIGKFKKITGEEVVDWDRSVSTAFAHCSRVSMETPAGVEQQKMVNEALFGKNIGDAAGIKHRVSATHDVARRTVDGTEPFEEKKLSFTRNNLWRAPINQRGMDIAVGGLGNPGVPGPGGQPQMLKNDGSCGHAYIRLKEGDEKHHGAILIGLESDSPSTKNQQGHVHAFKASPTPEHMSNLGGMRTDEIGDKLGGRHIDLTQLNPNLMVEVMEALEQKIRRSVKDSSPQALQELESINQQLVGKPMNTMELTTFLGKLDMRPERISQIVEAVKPPQNEQLRAEMQGRVAEIQQSQLEKAQIKPPDTAVYKAPKKPSGFQRLMHDLVGAYHETCTAYDSYVRSKVITFQKLTAAETPTTQSQPVHAPQPTTTLKPPTVEAGGKVK